MADFFSRNFFARLDRQLLSFDPEAQGEAKASGRKKRK